jgi:predicted glycosyltransferase
VDISQISGIAGKKQEGQNEQTTDERNVLCPAAHSGRYIEGHQGDNDLVKVIVESAEELRPEKAEEAPVFQQIDIAVFSHAVLDLMDFAYFSAKKANNSRVHQ